MKNLITRSNYESLLDVIQVMSDKGIEHLNNLNAVGSDEKEYVSLKNEFYTGKSLEALLRGQVLINMAIKRMWSIKDHVLQAVEDYTELNSTRTVEEFVHVSEGHLDREKKLLTPSQKKLIADLSLWMDTKNPEEICKLINVGTEFTKEIDSYIRGNNLLADMIS